MLANQRVGLHRKLMKTAAAADLYPTSIGADAIVYPSPGPSPLDVLPHTPEGKAASGTFRLGVSPGMVKYQGTQTVLWAEPQFEERGGVFNISNLIKTDTDERWQLIVQTSWRSTEYDLCGPCRQQDIDRAEAERVARREARGGGVCGAGGGRSGGEEEPRPVQATTVAQRGRGQVTLGRRLAHPGRLPRPDADEVGALRSRLLYDPLPDAPRPAAGPGVVCRFHYSGDTP
ncbi:hypothetical protein ABZY36_38845 [Streptomyces sp. NPDC006627]|uniref:hypothetical protein n=1 Tax=Streptomyces sp. NPDC006627 TaxID=3154679 RepID=UPI0033A5117C